MENLKDLFPEADVGLGSVTVIVGTPPEILCGITARRGSPDASK